MLSYKVYYFIDYSSAEDKCVSVVLRTQPLMGATPDRTDRAAPSSSDLVLNL